MIPDGWEEKQIGELARVVNGRAFKPIDWEREGAPIVRIQNLNGSHDFNYTTKAIEDKFWIENGSLLFAWSGSRGTSFGPYIWEGGKAVLNQHIFQLHLNDMGNRDFLYFALLELTRHIESTAHGSAGLVHVKKGDFESFKILMPGPQERVAIVSILQSLSASFRFAEKALAQARRLKQALLHQLLTKGIDENGKPHTRFKKTEIGEIPEEWEVVELENAAAPSSRITYGIVQTGENVEGGIPCVRVVDMVKSEISVDTLIKTSKEISDSYSRTLLKPGDLIFALRGEIGHVSVVGQSLKGCNLTRGVALIRPRADIDSKFLAWALRSKNVRAGIMDRVNGTALKEIPLKGLRRVLVPIPPPNEQKRIQECLESSLATELAASQCVSETHSFAKAVSSDLLSGRVRVKDLKL